MTSNELIYNDNASRKPVGGSGPVIEQNCWHQISLIIQSLNLSQKVK